MQDLCTFEFLKVEQDIKMVRQLVERIRKKDQRAMSQLYQMYVEELSSVCYRYVPDEDDAKDVLQNSFVKIFTTISALDYRGEDSFKAWMKRIVANEALGYLKQRKKLVFVEYNAASQDSVDDEPQPERLSPDELHKLISELPDGYRMVVNLYVFEGYSHKQIAELLSISERTSASQFYHAKRLLAKSIKDLTRDKR
jgi:RNA polymerase sigma-70 factor (ECF subfamily)